MRLRDRYRRLTLWNRIGVWGSVASIVGFLLAVGLLVVKAPVDTGATAPPLNITKLDFHEPKAGQAAAANVHYEVLAPSLTVKGNATLFVMTPRPGLRPDWDSAFHDGWALAIKRWEPGPELVVPRSSDVYFTSTGHQLSEVEAAAIRDGSGAFFLAGQIHYTGADSGTVEFCVLFKNGAKILCPTHSGPVRP